MLNDDRPVGRLLTRREAVALLGFVPPFLSAAHLRAQDRSGPRGTAVMPCVVQPEQTEGPYFVDGVLNRSDITAEPATGEPKAGVPLWITFAVSRLSGDRTCAPLAGAHVDLWQCDAKGIYSGVEDPRFNTVGQKFLRGYQLTDADGRARFRTIYPGWYRGRTVHVHFKVRTHPSEGRGEEFTSQLYFDDTLTDRVHRGKPYEGDGSARTRNEADRIFRGGGAQLVLAAREHEDGYAGEFALALAPGSTR